MGNLSRMNVTLNFALAVILVLCVLDYLTTVVIDRRPTGHENTVLVRHLQRKLGLELGTFSAKALVAGAAIGLYLFAPAPIALVAILLGIGFNGKAVAHNFTQL